MEGTGHGPICGTIIAYVWMEQENPHKSQSEQEVSKLGSEPMQS
jgi:hypothetical protein